MKKITPFLIIFLIFLLAQAGTLMPLLALADFPEGEGEWEEPEAIPGTVNCFDYYDFGSVKVNVGPSKHKFTAGQRAVFSGQLKNENDYPIVGGALFARVSRVETDKAKQRFNANHIVDEFFVKENINLDKKASQAISFNWLIPAGAGKGDYQLDFFFSVDKKFNLAGLPFTNEITAGMTNFKVESPQSASFYFERSETKINQEKYYHIGQWPVFEPGSQVTISQPLVNATAQAKTFKISYGLYWWDSLKEEDKLKSEEEEISVPAKSSKTLKYQIDSLNQPVLALKIKAQTGDESAILNLRVTSNTERPRLNYFGLTKFPLKKDETAALFSCVHNSSGIDTQGKLEIQLFNKDDKKIEQLEYQGKITSAMLGLAKEIAIKKNLDYLKLKASLFAQDGKLVDKSEQIYDCSAFQPSICLGIEKVAGEKVKKILSRPFYIILAILVIILLAIIVLLFRRGKGQGTIKSLVLLFLGLGAMLSLVAYDKMQSAPEGVEAANGFQVSQTENVSNTYQHSYGPWAKGCERTIAYGGVAIDHQVEVDKDNSEISVDDEINFNFQPENPFFFALGGNWDTPYGRWIKGGPGEMVLDDFDSSYEAADHTTGQWHEYEWDEDYDSYTGIMYCQAGYAQTHNGVPYYNGVPYCGKSSYSEREIDGETYYYYGDNRWIMYNSISNEWVHPGGGKPGAVSWGCWKPELSINSSDNSVIQCSGLKCQAKKAGTATLTINIEPTTCRIFSVIESKRWIGDYAVPWLWWPSDVKGSVSSYCGEDKTRGSRINGDLTNRLNLSEASFEWDFTVTSPEPPNNPPEARNPSITRPNWCEQGPNSVIFNWEYLDKDNEGGEDPQSAYQVQVATDSNFNNIAIDTGKRDSASHAFVPNGFSAGIKRDDLVYNKNYYWRVKVWDSKGAESDWLEPHAEPLYQTYNTVHHRYPRPLFTIYPEKPESGLSNPVTFLNGSKFWDGGTDEENSWQWQWEIEDANFVSGEEGKQEKSPEVYFFSDGSKEVTLSATDASAYKCPISTVIEVGKAPPWWREIWPF